MEANHAKQHPRALYATLKNAHKTALYNLGELGLHAARPAVVEYLLEAELY